MKRKQVVYIWLCLLMISAENFAQSRIDLGKKVSNIELKNTQNESKPIPGFGTKVIILFYTDPDCKDINDPLSTAIKDGGFKDAIAGIGISNCADSWIPDALIRQGAIKKEKQFPGSVILLDPDHRLEKAWGLEDCKNSGIVIIIGSDKKVKYFRSMKSEKESTEAIPEVIEIIKKEIR